MILSGILLARFSTVKYIPTIYSFLVTSLTVEARNERESHLFALLLIHFVSHTLGPPLERELSFSTGTFPNNYDIIDRKLYVSVIHLTVEI